MEMTQADITRIVQAFEESDWLHLRVSLGGTLLELSKSGPLDPGGSLAPAPSPHTSRPVMPLPEPSAAVAPPAQAAAPQHGVDSLGVTAGESAPGGLQEIVAPSVGVFWRAPSPTSPPFVAEGDAVAEGDTVCIVEVMKLMNHVAADMSGTVHSVVAENGQMVERGQVLFLVKCAP